MNEDVKKMWVDALRSGEYAQGQGRLATDDGRFCCLGVLCELAVGAGVATRLSNGMDGVHYDAPHIEGRETLPYGVRDWAGLADPNPSIANDEHGYASLAELNDDSFTFAEIADVIEADL